MREDENFRQHENDAENEKRRHFPARQTGEVVAEEKEPEANRGENAGHAGAGNLEFEVGEDHAAEQEERREGGNPETRAARSRPVASATTSPLRPAFCTTSAMESAMPSARTGLPSMRTVGFLRGQREQGALRVDDAVADFHFLLLVHEGFADVGVVAVAISRAADQGGPIGDRFVARGDAQIFAGGFDRRGGADGAHGRHVNVLGGESDEGAGGTGVGVDEGVGRNVGAVEQLGDFLRAIEPAAVGVHLENDRRPRLCFPPPSRSGGGTGTSAARLRPPAGRRRCCLFGFPPARPAFGAAPRGRRGREANRRMISWHWIRLRWRGGRPASNLPSAARQTSQKRTHGQHSHTNDRANRRRQRHRRSHWLVFSAQAGGGELQGALSVSSGEDRRRLT